MEETKVTRTEPGHPDAHRSKLRRLVALIEGELPHTPALQAAWRELGVALALGPEPATRSCTACRAIVMRDATRCGHCWVALVEAPPAGG